MQAQRYVNLSRLGAVGAAASLPLILCAKSAVLGARGLVLLR